MASKKGKLPVFGGSTVEQAVGSKSIISRQIRLQKFLKCQKKTGEELSRYFNSFNRMGKDRGWCLCRGGGTR